jgi:ABC-type multidrug transport system fused ATPase/permease subunit
MPGFGPKANLSITTRRGNSPIHFLRVLRFARPYGRYLYPGLICIVVVALTYTMNIAALLPMVKIIADDQGMPSWVHQYIAEQRLGYLLVETDGRLQVVATRGLRRLPPGVRDRDLVTVPSRPDDTTAALYREIAYMPDGASMSLRFDRPIGGESVEATAALDAISAPQRAMRFGVSFLPAETTKAARMKTLMILLGGVMTVTVIGGISRFFGEYLISLTAGRTIVALRRRMYQRVLALPVSHFATRGVSDTVSRFVQDSQDIYRGLNFVFAKSLREPLKAVFAFALALSLDWRITIVTVIIAPLAGVLIRKFGKLIRKAQKRLLEGYGRMLSALESSLVGIRVVKGYTMESYERRHLHSVDVQMLKQQMKIERIDAFTSPVFETIGVIAATLAIMYFADQMFDNKMDFSRFAALGACMAGMFDPVRKMSSFYNRIQQANAALDRVFEVIDLPIEHTGPHRAAALPAFSDRIEFRDVAFTYAGAEQPAINGINLVIQRGERVAFVGPNGSGKTTLLALLMRFFEPSRGRILMDGRDIGGHSIDSLRRQISLVTQDTVIFADTIAHNIAYGDERLLRKLVLRRRHPDRFKDAERAVERIHRAAEAAYADEFIREKPEGYDTYVGEHGITLSGGQKQRIAIARAILRNAPIFIFDEATSQVDAESEQKIHDAVERFLEGRTAMIIAHRFSTIRQADRIVVMDRGRIIDSGRHDELMQRCRLYQTLYGSQLLESSPAADEAVGVDAR